MTYSLSGAFSAACDRVKMWIRWLYILEKTLLVVHLNKVIFNQGNQEFITKMVTELQEIGDQSHFSFFCIENSLIFAILLKRSFSSSSLLHFLFCALTSDVRQLSYIYLILFWSSFCIVKIIL